jgi:APA family basic amino acid/polyamine antiporter
LGISAASKGRGEKGLVNSVVVDTPVVMLVMRKTHAQLERPFKTPLVPLVPVLSIICSGGLIISLALATQIRLIAWLLIGLFIYFTYGRKHSKVQISLMGSKQSEDEQM